MAEGNQYDPRDLARITANKSAILDTAKILGVRPNAIAGTVLEELNDARFDLGAGRAKAFFHSLGNYNNLTHSEIRKSHADFYDAADKDPNLLLFSRDTVLKIADYSRVKIKYPVLFDIGEGSIQIRTAIDSLNAYNENFPDSDPLQIKQYNRDYPKLVRDLQDKNNPLTYKIAGLVVKEAQEFFRQSIPNNGWDALSSDQQDALIVTYYNLGADRILLNAVNAGDNYNPRVGDGGRQHLIGKNPQLIQETLEENSAIKSGAPECFPGFTQIALPDGTSRPISDIAVGDIILSFDPDAENGRGALVPGVVTRLYANVTEEWFKVSLPPQADGTPSRPLYATPGHEMLRPEGGYARLSQMVTWTSRDAGTVSLVAQDGTISRGAVEDHDDDRRRQPRRARPQALRNHGLANEWLPVIASSLRAIDAG
jgi:hypothetical protein